MKTYSKKEKMLETKTKKEKMLETKTKKEKMLETKTNKVNVVNIRNCGLGNQMFMYAFGKILENKTKIKSVYYLDERFHHKESVRKFCLNKLNVNLEMIFDAKLKKLNLKTIRTHPREYNPDILNNTEGNGFYDGQWENIKWGFSDIKEQLIEDFRIKDPMDKENSELLDKIKKTNSVAVNVRINNPKTDEKNLVSLDKKYYKRAMSYIASRIENAHFFIFSEFQDLAKNILDLKGYNYTFVNINDDSKNYLDLELMKNCKHNITSYSTFSWWGSFLNKNPQKIVTLPDGEWYDTKTKYKENICGYSLQSKELCFENCVILPVN